MLRYILPVLLSVAFVLSQPLSVTLRADEATPLGERMEEVSDAYKSLRKGLRDPQEKGVDQYKKWAAEIVEAAQAAKDMTPALAAELKGKEKEKLIADYKKDMDAFILKAQELQRRLAKGDLEGAAKTIGLLNKLKKDGHTKYQEEEDE